MILLRSRGQGNQTSSDSGKVDGFLKHAKSRWIQASANDLQGSSLKGRGMYIPASWRWRCAS